MDSLVENPSAYLHEEIIDLLNSGNDNPLNAKIGDVFLFPHQLDIKDIHFKINCISKSEDSNHQNYVDYHLVGTCSILNQENKFRLRLVPQDDFHFRILLLHVFEQKEWNETLQKKLNHKDGEFYVSHDDEGMPLKECRKYWRVQDTLEPLSTAVKYVTKHCFGKVPFLVCSYIEIIYWDFFRQTVNSDGSSFLEFLIIEFDKQTKKTFSLRGFDIPLDHLSHIANS